MNFGNAIQALKDGRSVARAGWNGKRMYVTLNKGSHDYHSKNGESVEVPDNINGVPILLFEGGDKGTVTRNPYLTMMGAQGNLIPGWLPTQTDLLAEDWEIIF